MTDFDPAQHPRVSDGTFTQKLQSAPEADLSAPGEDTFARLQREAAITDSSNPDYNSDMEVTVAGTQQTYRAMIQAGFDPNDSAAFAAYASSLDAPDSSPATPTAEEHETLLEAGRTYRRLGLMASEQTLYHVVKGEPCPAAPSEHDREWMRLAGEIFMEGHDEERAGTGGDLTDEERTLMQTLGRKHSGGVAATSMTLWFVAKGSGFPVNPDPAQLEWLNAAADAYLLEYVPPKKESGS